MYLNKKQLIERGWSPKLIKEFLGEPDDEQRLGYYCWEHLYFLPRVENVEKTEEFQDAQTAYLMRRERGKAVAKKRAEERIEKAKTMRIVVHELPYEDVLENAILLYNARTRGEYYDDDGCYSSYASRDSDELFLQRITVNYIRHHLTSYDRKLFAQKGKIGGGEAIPIIRRRVFEEIAIAYPSLADECDRQMLRRGLITEIEILNKNKPIYEQLELPLGSF